jgi:hypothetical protein
MSQESTDVTCFGDTNRKYVVGLPNIEASFTGYFDSTYISTMDTARASADGIKVYLYPSSDAMTLYWYGPAWMDFSVQSDVNGAIGVTGSLRANGDWGSKL